jgi:hypothetical protein
MARNYTTVSDYGTTTTTNSYSNTCSTSYHYVPTGRWEQPAVAGGRKSKLKKEKSKMATRDMFKSNVLRCILGIDLVKNSLAIFAHRNSPVFSDSRILVECYGLHTYYNDPIFKGYDSPTELASYNYALITDALEYLPNMMSKANLIKEALATLRPSNEGGRVVIAAKTPKMVASMAKKEKYEKLDDGFIISEASKEASLRGYHIEGLEVEDLVELAFFAGANDIVTDPIAGMEESCVRIRLNGFQG